MMMTIKDFREMYSDGLHAIKTTRDYRIMIIFIGICISTICVAITVIGNIYLWVR